MRAVGFANISSRCEACGLPSLDTVFTATTPAEIEQALRSYSTECLRMYELKELQVKTL